MIKEKFDVQGMTCSSCSAHVEKAVKKLNGVVDVNVNLLSSNMIVKYDEKIIDNKKIISSVVQAGFPASVEKNEIKVENDLKVMKKRLIISIFFLIQLMYISMHNMYWEVFKLPIPEFVKNIFDGTENAIIYAFSQLVLLIPIIIVNRKYFIVGFKRLFKLSPNMDSLIAIGSSAATLYGILAIGMIIFGLKNNRLDIVQRYSKDVYFESAGTILTLITLGKYLESKAKGKTSDAISKLINLAPKTATVIRNDKEIEIKTEDIIVGDIIIIKPGTSIPLDGVVIEGNSSVDQSSITGESMPVVKNINDNLVSGTINKNGYLKMKATKVGDDTTLSQIVKLVEEASNSKAPISKIADKVSLVFVPIVITIAILTGIIWIFVGQSFEFALTNAIAVLVISCPCALGLATPVAIMVGTGKGAENGILIKSAESLELLHQVNTIVLDKTGTITEGKPKVIDIITNQSLLGTTSNLNNGRVKIIGNINNNILAENEVLRIAGSLEAKSEHPLAESILEKVKEKNIKLQEITEFSTISGRGITGKIVGVNYFGGNEAFMNENGINTDCTKSKVTELENQGKTCLYFAKEKSLLGIIAVADPIKTTSKIAINNLKNKGLEIAMITGDNKIVAQSIGERLGIDRIISEVLPQDKEKEVEKMQLNGKKVAFVGDGINDSPALVKADVGIAIGSGTDIAIESADIVLMKNSLLDVDTAISLSKAVIRNIKMNLFWAFFYNSIGIPIATGIFYNNFGLKLNPMIGALAMSLSSVCVVTNALRLRKFKSNNNNIKEEFIVMTKTIYIEGMQCNHCKMSVEKALMGIEGISKVEVSLQNKSATIEYPKELEGKIKDEKIKEAIEGAGFKLMSN